MVTGQKEAFIVDTYVPISPKSPIINVKGALAKILENKELIGLIITGFDADHFNEVGMKIILNKYRPNWIMYPKYFKNTSVADNCFAVIDSFESSKQIKRYSVLLSENSKRFYNDLSKEFYYEVFSPHSEDMNSSNNCSLVCRVVENTSKKTYLITGDTEYDRWSSILKYFSSNLKSDVLAAPHHGSKNGITEDLMSKIHPHSVLISAGIDNQYGHPDKDAIAIYHNVATEVYRTNQNNGISLVTKLSQLEIKTYLFQI